MDIEYNGDSCNIVVPTKQKVGTFVNAFRVLPDVGDEVLLDFCIYSQQEQEANVVARLRVHREFLVQIRDRLNLTMQEIPVETVSNELVH